MSELAKKRKAHVETIGGDTFPPMRHIPKKPMLTHRNNPSPSLTSRSRSCWSFHSTYIPDNPCSEPIVPSSSPSAPTRSPSYSEPVSKPLPHFQIEGLSTADLDPAVYEKHKPRTQPPHVHSHAHPHVRPASVSASRGRLSSPNRSPCIVIPYPHSVAQKITKSPPATPLQNHQRSVHTSPVLPERKIRHVSPFSTPRRGRHSSKSEWDKKMRKRDREKQRRQNINEEFRQLSGAVDLSPQSDKITILGQARRVIADLKEEIKMLKDQQTSSSRTNSPTWKHSRAEYSRCLSKPISGLELLTTAAC